MAGYDFKAALFNGKACQSLDQAQALDLFQKQKGLLWIDLVGEDTQVMSELLLSMGFHHLEVEDALSANERPALRSDEGSFFLVAPAILSEKVDEEEQYVEVAFFVGKHYLVSVATQHVPDLAEWFTRCETKPTATGKSPDLLLHSLIDMIVDQYFPAIDDIGSEIDALEEKIYGGHRVNVGEALQLKRRLLEMRRRIAPIRDILNSMLRRDIATRDMSALQYYQDVYDHALRVMELIDMQREILSAVLDSHLSIVSNNLNQVMRTMTIVSTVLMSMAFVSGIYGMNFTHMPELTKTWGYPFALGLMALVAIVEILIFKKLKWM